MLNIKPRAWSLKPNPGRARCPADMEALRVTISSITVSVAPADPRYLAYRRRAMKNREGNREAVPLRVQHAKTSEGGNGIDGDLCTQASIAALRWVSRKRLPWWATRDDLVGIGCLAILEAGARDRPLAVKVARCAMVDFLRKETVRQRDREWAGEDQEPDGLLDGERSYTVRQPEEPRVARRYNLKQPASAGRDASLWESLKALPPRQQTAMRLHLDGCSYAEIAQRTDTTPRAVEGLLGRALGAMKEILDP